MKPALEKGTGAENSTGPGSAARKQFHTEEERDKTVAAAGGLQSGAQGTVGVETGINYSLAETGIPAPFFSF